MDENENTLTTEEIKEAVSSAEISPAENPEPPEKNPQENINPEPVQYDAFMSEPIGFEQNSHINPAYDEINDRKLHKRRERTVIVMFFILILITFIFGLYGIVADILKSSDNLAAFNNGQGVVIYQNTKPYGADNPENFVDENGKYTTEGAAAAVRDSIVEIYSYSDNMHTSLLGTGSGVILSAEGYIVTNAHVLEANGYHDVHTADGKIYNAKIVGRDTKTDIAVLKISADNLTPAILGDSDEVMVGEQVIAVGNPAGLSNTVTDGIVSAINRKVRSDSTGFEMNCIQTNADINFGNSGGALVNMYGQVIGITSSKYSSTMYEGLGFAITINEAKPIIEELINNGFISGRFRIGISFMGMDSQGSILAIEQELGYSLPEDFSGIYISSISEDCDISNTELKAGDFITEINDVPVNCYDELYSTITATFKAGDTVPAKCAHVSEDGKITRYDIKFKLMEDTSGDY